jgi:hypothetical protein
MVTASETTAKRLKRAWENIRSKRMWCGGGLGLLRMLHHDAKPVLLAVLDVELVHAEMHLSA